MKKIIIALFLVISSVPCALADFAKGLAAYEAGEYKTALLEWTVDAENDDVAAMRNIGHMFRWGRGVEKNLITAAYWYKKAADKGFDKAQYNLALLYLDGEGVAKDIKEAVHWLELASSQGHAEASKKLEELRQTQAENVVKDVAKEKIAAPSKEKTEETSTSAVAKKLDITEKEQVKKETDKKANQALEKAIKPDLKEDKELLKTAVKNSDNKAEKEEQSAVHISSYNSEDGALSGWSVLRKKYKNLDQFKMELKKVEVKGKVMIRLFAKGKTSDALALCQAIKNQKEYCVVYDKDGKKIF
ncbi:MAG: hypothetical protein AB7U85_03210 [Alphaproteobacteria bacterium]